VLPSVSKIADDADEIEILESKKSILKEIKRHAQHVLALEIEEGTQPKLQRVQVQREQLYPLIETHKELGEIELEVSNIEKDVDKAEKRLYEYDVGLKQFESELKEDFYNDSKEEMANQARQLADLDKQIAMLNEGIDQIEEALKQAALGTDDEAKRAHVAALQERLKELKELRNAAERMKRELQRDGNLLKGELDNVDLDNITPSSLQDLQDEIAKQGRLIDEQDSNLKGMLDDMKALKEAADQAAFKAKADKRHQCKTKLRGVGESLDELERLLDEINSMLEMIEKDRQFLRDTEWSPMKGKSPTKGGSSVKFDVGDLEKDQEVGRIEKQILKENNDYDELEAAKR